jgi:pimeloyl-ACP methyl ester carboxylesterase
MPLIEINGNAINYEESGDGSPLVLVHGSWDGGHCWDALRPELDSSHRVVSYDRRGHSSSERPAAAWTRRDNEDDLAALIEALELGPVHLVGNSYGGLVSLGLAARRPEIVRGVTVHEPPAISLLDGRGVAEVTRPLEAVLAEIGAGDAGRATRRFMDEVALGPGSWAQMPQEMRASLTANAPAFAVEMADPGCSELRLADLDRLDGPVQVTRGDASPPWLVHVAEQLAGEIRGADAATIAGAGHAPHETHPRDYADVIRAFAREPAQVSI